ncbi:MAG: Hpt domain-containing protein, partial [Methylophaga sp.]|nr:Hpt domain-containing protein [Methylophaga sp.]
MALDTDDEILQDFMVEAEEILDGLNEQLVALESQPQDSDLLNAIFRGFHTIKGGAGFLSLDAMVALCHKGEDVFNLLRQGERHVDADMMDTFLKVLDSLNAMFAELKSGEYPQAADPAILTQLAAYLEADAAPAPPAPEPEPEPEPVSEPPASTGGDDITDDEFEALLDQLHGNAAPGVKNPPSAEDPPAKSPAADDEMTEAEFEALLDELQGKKKAPTAPPPSTAEPVKAAPLKNVDEPPPAADKATESTNDKPMQPAKAAPPPAETSVRVDTARLDEIMNMVGELVLVRNRINTLEAAFENEEMAKAVN